MGVRAVTKLVLPHGLVIINSQKKEPRGSQGRGKQEDRVE